MQIKLSNDVLFNEVDNESVLFNLETGNYFGLNEVGVDFWNIAQNQSDFSKIIDELLNIYNIDKETLVSDIKELVSEMQKAKLLSTE